MHPDAKGVRTHGKGSSERAVIAAAAAAAWAAEQQFLKHAQVDKEWPMFFIN